MFRSVIFTESIGLVKTPRHEMVQKGSIFRRGSRSLGHNRGFDRLDPSTRARNSIHIVGGLDPEDLDL